MAGANLTTLSNILKEYYMGPVVEQLNKEVLLLSRLESRSEDLVGKRAYVPLQAARTGGIGARSENADLPAAGNYTYEKAVYDLKYLYGKASVTGPSMAKTKSEAGAFLQVLKAELDGLRLDLRKDLARQVYGDGSGDIAGVASIADSSGSPATQVVTLDVSSSAGYIKGDGREAINKGQLYVGMVVDVLNGSGAIVTNGGGRTITAVDASVPSITLDVATAGDIDHTGSEAAWTIVRSGVTKKTAAESNTYSLSDEIDGLRRIVGGTDTTGTVSVTAALGGITPTGSNSWWAPQTATLDDTTANASGTYDLAFDDIQKILNKVRTAGGTPTAMITSLGVHREFYNLFTNMITYNDPDQRGLDYGAGFRTLTYNGMPVVADIDAPYGHLYVIDESTLKVFSDQDFHFLDADGQTLRQSGDKDAFEAVMVRYMNMGATRRNNQAVIANIAVDGALDQGF